MTVPVQAFTTLLQLAEDRLARAGFAVVPTATMQLIDRVERSPATATADDYSRILYAIYSGPYGEYHRALVTA